MPGKSTPKAIHAVASRDPHVGPDSGRVRMCGMSIYRYRDVWYCTMCDCVISRDKQKDRI